MVAIDLRNEPHTQSFSSYGTGSTWGTGNTATDWNRAAQKAGNAILAANPSLLIAVEGISDWVNDSGQTVSDWWGGDLQPVATSWVGEFGTPNGATDASDTTPGSQGQWFSGIVQYIKANTLSWTLEFPFGTPPSSPLAFTFPGDQQITNSWSSTFQQTGTSASLKDAGYNATIPPGGNVSFGFQGTWTTNDAAPVSFTLNGAVCR